MLRRLARERREYLYRKSIEDKRRTIEEKKERLKQALEENRPIPYELRAEALALQEQLDWDDPGGEGVVSQEDDEYRWAGVRDPKIVVTTSRDPSSKLKQFAKEMRLIFPNAQRMNRGGYEMKQLIEACRANEVTDFIVVHETRGNPDGLVICHLPYGPTAYFTILNTVMRHDIPNIGTMSEAYPHLIFHNFKTRLGKRVTNILKYLFPVPKEDSHRVITFANQDDYISFRHHTFKKEGKDYKLQEVGPRFELKLYEIKLGTLDATAALDVEWSLRPYMNTARKRKFLSDEDAFDNKDTAPE
uniref:Putative ribosome bioproteinsis protein rpf1 n=1 Tax=Ixodes ricinus TaxID=34613 RepID=A0A6B0V7S5_IXORI